MPFVVRTGNSIPCFFAKNGVFPHYVVKKGHNNVVILSPLNVVMIQPATGSSALSYFYGKETSLNFESERL